MDPPSRSAPSPPGEQIVEDRALEGPTPWVEDRSVVTARVVAVDYQGTITLESERGPTDAWVVDPTKYRFGDRMRIDMSVRPSGPTSTPPGQSTSPTLTEPGDYAIVTGPVIAKDPRGTVSVQSPRGPIRVWVDPSRLGLYRIGSVVEVRTRVRPASIP